MRIATWTFLYLFSLIAMASAILGYLSIQDERRHLLSVTSTDDALSCLQRREFHLVITDIKCPAWMVSDCWNGSNPLVASLPL